ncbi:MAG: MoaD/ThiS family protein [Vulcanisaeta sp.]|uniref:MoaD/ThiS family protein n=1 Tax=Vulcanisaeta sp. EB80 TaxID=1650660 RepID=UPI000749EE6A|nr:MoaD/ThiS family protein [Vulcanisaeta sp. EB80]KUO79449.1 MAG: molybdopterin synthase sulfur carrier subunit [Vulcanisaeta sp. JCHS_4]KUO94404.1 MAG: molybdopterin synthase sulfur carrier subunit [Vulcanisaeta sp. CIS_19]MCG2864441.1 MoaD/ThiS family protein [Vulcanisaeta sp.]MCG2866504.1 MoaD/ThiS family protein [Vulcanisaeta sp.]MCG2885002.1 MoaD/ThiS family protein [Vulcanisaeta sp.]
MVVRVRLVGVLKALALGKDYLELNNANNVRDVINGLKSVNDKLFRRVFDASRNDLMPDIYIAVNNVDIRLLKGLDTPINDNDEVLIIAYIHGG